MSIYSTLRGVISQPCVANSYVATILIVFVSADMAREKVMAITFSEQFFFDFCRTSLNLVVFSATVRLQRHPGAVQERGER